MRPRPKILIDIKPTAGTDVFAERAERINISMPRRRTFPTRYVQFAAAALAVAFFWGSSALAPVGGNTLAQTSSAERAALEAELEKLEKQISDYESTISDYRKQGQSLKGEIGVLEAKIQKINLQIKAINISLAKLNGEINVTTSKIKDVEGSIDVNRDALAALIRKMNEEDKRGLIEVLMGNPNLSDFFGSVNDLLTMQDSLRSSLVELTQLKDELITQKELLAMERSDVEALKKYQVLQKEEVNDVRAEKDNLLKVTKGKESEYKKLLTDTQKTAAQIRSRIFELLGGGQLTFEKAYEFAKFAENATGVRAALILAVLDRESALGGNVGRCFYNTPRNNDSGTVMSNSQKPSFLRIMEELKMNPDTTPVSCPIASDGQYGGAMGPAQFMPLTWDGYKDKIAAVTGNNPPSPWRNADAFVATGLYLKNAGAGSNELQAAAKYYCGGNWQRYTCTNVYGKRVLETANRFQKDIDILNS